jgi:hypothetical protein
MNILSWILRSLRHVFQDYCHITLVDGYGALKDDIAMILLLLIVMYIITAYEYA